MKILVIGGYGDIGSCVVEKLIDFSTHQVTIAGRDPNRARALCKSFRAYVAALRVDLENKSSLTSAFERFDLVINCAGPFYKYGANAATAAIETRTHYVDTCDDPDPLPKLFALDTAARNSGVAIITGLGWNPGISNMAALLASQRLDQVDDISIAWVVGSADSKGLAAAKHMLHGITGDVPMLRNGKKALLEAWTEPEIVEFSSPLRELPTLLFGHPEPLTLPRMLTAKNISVRGGISPPWNNKVLSIVRGLGLTSTPQRIDSVAGIIHKIQRLFSMGGVPHSGLRIDIIGKANGQERHLVFNMLDRIRPLTAVPCAIGALMLLEGKIARRGVMAPEMCIEPVEFFDRLSNKGLRILREGRL